MHAKLECWRLKLLIDEAREGRLAPARPPGAWSAERVEALWENILNDWPIGPFVLVDVPPSSDRPWRGRLGPHPVRPGGPRRRLVTEGAGQLAALGWSLLERPTPMPYRLEPAEADLWNHHLLMLDLDERRARFVRREDASPQGRLLPVRLLPQTDTCLRAMGALSLRPVDREWINQAARRLLETPCPVYLFPDRSDARAEHMIANCHRIADSDEAEAEPPVPPPQRRNTATNSTWADHRN